jgi:hypothetical protein
MVESSTAYRQQTDIALGVVTPACVPWGFAEAPHRRRGAPLAHILGHVESCGRTYLAHTSDAGGGTRTPDTRIMIGVNC